MATSFTGPPVADRALATAPLPRLPLPTMARRMVLSSPAWTCGIVTLASAEAAANRAVLLRKSRRGVLLHSDLGMENPPKLAYRFSG